MDGLCFCWDPATPRVPPAPSSGKAQLSDERPCDYFTEAMYNELGPDAEFPYTYEGLCLAIDHYNEGHAEKIFMMGTEEEKKKEFAAFLGHSTFCAISSCVQLHPSYILLCYNSFARV